MGGVPPVCAWPHFLEVGQGWVGPRGYSGLDLIVVGLIVVIGPVDAVDNTRCRRSPVRWGCARAVDGGADDQELLVESWRRPQGVHTAYGCGPQPSGATCTGCPRVFHSPWEKISSVCPMVERAIAFPQGCPQVWITTRSVRFARDDGVRHDVCRGQWLRVVRSACAFVDSRREPALWAPGGHTCAQPCGERWTSC